MCEYCEIIPQFYEHPLNGKTCYDEEKSQKILHKESWYTYLVIGADKNGKIYIGPYYEGAADFWYPNFCPVCGRDLREQNEKLEKT